MARPLAGIKVVELGAWGSGTAVGGILADRDAEVVKVEPPNGNPARVCAGRSSLVGTGGAQPHPRALQITLIVSRLMDTLSQGTCHGFDSMVPHWETSQELFAMQGAALRRALSH